MSSPPLAAIPAPPASDITSDAASPLPPSPLSPNASPPPHTGLPASTLMAIVVGAGIGGLFVLFAVGIFVLYQEEAACSSPTPSSSPPPPPPHTLPRASLSNFHSLLSFKRLAEPTGLRLPTWNGTRYTTCSFAQISPPDIRHHQSHFSAPQIGPSGGGKPSADSTEEQRVVARRRFL